MRREIKQGEVRERSALKKRESETEQESVFECV